MEAAMTVYSEIKALNFSSLKNIDISPKMFAFRQQYPRPDSSALALGRAIHMAVLEPDQFREHYAIRPRGIDMRTRDGKAWRDDQNAAGREILDDAGLVTMVASAVRQHQAASDLIDGCRYEETITWSIDEIACKGRVDAIGVDRLIDLKTCRDLTRFPRDVANYQYHAQMAWYLDGAVAARVLPADAAVYIVAVETQGCVDCGVYRIPPHVLDVGRSIYRSWISTWRECIAAGIWPGLCPGVEDLELPAWADRAATIDTEDW